MADRNRPAKPRHHSYRDFDEKLPGEPPPKPRRLELLDSARSLFFHLGYLGTTIQEIAESAGYSKRTVYLDFPTKDELFITLCVEGGELLLDRIEDIPHPTYTVEQCIEQFIDAFTAFSHEWPQYFRMIFSEATPAILAGCSQKLRERAAALERACFSVVVQLIERAVREHIIGPVDPWETAGILVGAATGITLLSMGGSQTVFSPEKLESLVSSALWTLWRGLCSMAGDGGKKRRR